MSQQRADTRSGQRVAGVEVAVPPGDTTKVTLALPFGVLLEEGVAVQVDDGPASPRVPSTPAIVLASTKCRRVATRCDKLAANDLAFIQLASIRPWLRVKLAFGTMVG